MTGPDTREAPIEYTSPTEIREAEHRVIQKIVSAMAVMTKVLEAGNEANADTLRNIVEFMRIFADKCHHGTEEVHFFPCWSRKGFRRAVARWGS